MRLQRQILDKLITVALLSIFLLGCAGTGAQHTSKEEKRADVRRVAKQTLANLYQIQPNAQKHIANAAGYAVFSNFGMKLFVAGGGAGEGLAVNNQTGQETFMKMVEVQAGLGFSIKKFRLIWVFEKVELLNNFIHSGWEIGGQATVAAKVGDKGQAYAGAMSIAPGIWIYQLTDEGLALELTAKGSKYYKNDELN